MPLWVWQACFTRVQKSDTLGRLSGPASMPRSSLNSTLIWVHISVEMKGRKVRAFSRAAFTQL